MKTRSIVAKVKPLHVQGVSSKPIQDPGSRRNARNRRDEKKWDEDHDYENPLADINSVGGVIGYLKDVRAEVSERVTAVKRILTSKELNPLPPESNLLHWAARQQIRYLHKQDPLEWSPERISEEFPISVLGAKRLLGCNTRIPEDQIDDFDKEVDERWNLLRRIRRTGKVPEKGRVHLHAKTIELFLKGELQSEHLKAGNPDFPKAPPLLDIKVPYPVGREGKHFSVYEEYANLLDDGSSNDEAKVSTTVKSDHNSISTPDEIGDDPEVATHLDLPHSLRSKLIRTRRFETMTLDDFKKNANVGTMGKLAGGTDPKKEIKKKKLIRSDDRYVKPLKFKDTPRRATGEAENDGTYTVGRTVFATDGEILYRKTRG